MLEVSKKLNDFLGVEKATAIKDMALNEVFSELPYGSDDWGIFSELMFDSSMEDRSRIFETLEGSIPLIDDFEENATYICWTLGDLHYAVLAPDYVQISSDVGGFSVIDCGIESDVLRKVFSSVCFSAMTNKEGSKDSLIDYAVSVVYETLADVNARMREVA